MSRVRFLSPAPPPIAGPSELSVDRTPRVVNRDLHGRVDTPWRSVSGPADLELAGRVAMASWAATSRSSRSPESRVSSRTANTEDAVRARASAGEPVVLQVGGEQRGGDVAGAVGLHRQRGVCTSHAPSAVDREHLDDVVGRVPRGRPTVTSTVRRADAARLVDRGEDVLERRRRLGRPVGDEAELELVGRDHVGDRHHRSRSTSAGSPGSRSSPTSRCPSPGRRCTSRRGWPPSPAPPRRG